MGAKSFPIVKDHIKKSMLCPEKRSIFFSLILYCNGLRITPNESFFFTGS